MEEDPEELFSILLQQFLAKIGAESFIIVS
jgi:hypothetical protein